MEKECYICQLIVDVNDPSNRRSQFKICDMESSIAVLSSDQSAEGYTLVIYKEHVSELYHLSPEKRGLFCEEMITIANALDKTFHPDKMNYELLGNKESHMHWHLFPRYRTDPCWGKPVWVKHHEKKKLTNDEYQGLIQKIRKHL